MFRIVSEQWKELRGQKLPMLRPGTGSLMPFVMATLAASGLVASGCEPALVRDNPHDPSSVTFVDQDADQYGSVDDCNDTNASVHPGASEVCNGEDDNCDNAIDEDLALSTWYADQDGDGYGDQAVTTESCSQPEGYVDDANDCLDNDKDVHPGQKDVCNALDDDCDGRQDEDEAPDTYYGDSDKDGFGDPDSTTKACDKPAGTVANSDDCNDKDQDINPQASEVCNEVDDDCNDEIDDGLDFGPWYEDLDGDTYGDSNTEMSTCAPEEGWVNIKGDCNDSSASQFPGAEEACNQQDDNCSGISDEGLAVSPYYSDLDEDGYGAGGSIGTSCSTPAGFSATDDDCDDSSGSVHPDATEVPYDGLDQDCDGFDLQDVDKDGVIAEEVGGTDCDDTDPAISPKATEACNLTDDDCDTLIDEDFNKDVYFADRDGDSFGDPLSSAEYCKAVDGWVRNSDDCNDSAASVHPGAEEVCNFEDDNCDGVSDESLTTQTYYRDLDQDTFGVSSDVAEACMQPEGYAAQDGDCNDQLPTINPDEVETFDLLDNDCDGSIDNQIDLSIELESSFQTTENLISRKMLGVGQPVVEQHGIFTQLGSAGVPNGVAYYRRDVLGKLDVSPTALFLTELKYAGFDLAVSDFDGDGLDDVAISLLSPSECTVYIFAGSTAGFSGSYASDQATYVYTGSGSDKCGYSLAPITDVYPSGKALLALGAPGAGDGAGSVVILDIDSALPSDSWPQRVISGKSSGGALGSGLLTAPGSELWVGEPGSNGGSGIVFRVSLPENGAVVGIADVQQTIVKWSDTSVAERPVLLSEKGLGYLDLNGDGILELVLPSETHDGLGSVYVISSANKLTGAWALDQADLAMITVRGSNVSGSSTTTELGFSAVSMGDLNLDGSDELMMGAVRTESTAGSTMTYPEFFLLLGDSSVRGLSLPSRGVPSFTVPGAVSTSMVDLFSAGAADVDGDSYRELFFQVAGYPRDAAYLQGKVTTPYVAN